MAKKPTQNKGGGVANLRPFKPGQSGNPGGRSKGIVARVKELVGEDGSKALELLALMAFGEPAALNKAYGSSPNFRDRREAIRELLDRGFGKPVQSLEHSGPEGGPMDFGGLSQEDLQKRAQAVLEQMAKGK